MTLEKENDTEVRVRGPVRLLVSRDFGGFFWGKLASASSNYLHAVVASIVVFGITGSAVMVAMVTVAQFAPQLAFALPAGARADRGGAVRQVIWGRFVCALGSGGLAVWMAAVPPGNHQPAAVIVASLVCGFGLVIGGPAMQSITPRLVTRSELPTAMALNTVPMTVGRIAGPAVGAVLVLLAGPTAAFVVAAGGQALFVIMLMFIRVPSGGDSTPEAHGAIRAALAYVRADRPLLLLMMAVTALGFGSEPINTLAPSLVHELGDPPGGVGVITGGFGVGAAIGIVVSVATASRISHERVVTIGLWLMALGIGSCAFLPGLLGVVIAVAIVGVGFIVANSSAGTLIQLRVPAELRGRVMALWLMGFVGARPAAALCSGVFADLFTVGGAFVVIGICTALVAFVCLPARLSRPIAPPGGSRRISPVDMSAPDH